MTPKIAKVRRSRADAERNRQRLLQVAKLAFAEKGMSATLDDIARGAGLGIGTLYRHFPTRDALLDQLYSHEVSQLEKGAERLSTERPAMDALSEWLLLFIDYLAQSTSTI